ncbi:hypothetical protein LEL_09982 [Akanthomyces lecanii RCEF 1005]|uniref:Uncharacterized protein n=1 Tax=Akanthomyces lecanii RCEF 1005 TaxID=1081108 RepID=A0A168BII8_CORDF|nr:hypothetical protein LEL_09982 [Akanthomyces lecanii RCEF 1005]
MSDYKPTEHDGLKQDEFAHGKVDPHKAGAKGGNQSGDGTGETQSASDSSGGDYKPTEHDGLRKDGEPDGRVKGN